MLEVKNIFKSYAGQPLLKNISFKIKKAETVCLLGASGSGKSTLLQLIAGLEKPDAGMIRFNGADLAQTPPHLRDFGLVFQDYGLFPHLNIYENIAFGLKMKNKPAAEIQARVSALLTQVNLTGFEQRKVTELSGGEQQRVALARALAPNPRLMMFDEPLGALDKNHKESLLNELRALLRREKIPALYVTHDQEEAFALADCILLLHDGQIIRAGTPEEIWNDPRSAVAAKFFGVGNVVTGAIKLTGKKTQVETEFGTFNLYCKYKHKPNESVSVLIRQCDDGSEALKLKVEDLLFKQDQFQAQSRGAFFFVKEKPKLGQLIRLRVKVECLHENSEEKY
ncbi:MAG: ABC transporter ATP-binding protein [Anaerolineales bacterium]|nr:ABC transporter ATP-binding protein [Anaerolineales bacterium]